MCIGISFCKNRADYLPILSFSVSQLLIISLCTGLSLCTISLATYTSLGAVIELYAA